MKSRQLKFAAAGCLILAFLLPPAALPAAQPAEGKMTFLVARRVIRDPYFERSVVFMLPASGAPLVVGLIINKTAPVPLGKLFPDRPTLKNRTVTACFGGPVEVGVPSLVFEASQPPDRALRLYGNVYLTFDTHLIIATLEKQPASTKFRLFLGRAQWSPEQLQNEIGHAAWYTIRDRGDLIFSPSPGRLWQTLHERASPSHYVELRQPIPANN